MKLEDVTPLISTADTSPEEAGTNIQESQELGFPPSYYAKQKEEINKEVKIRRSPSQVHPAIAKIMSKSDQHSSLITPDLDALETVSRYMDYFSDTFKGKSRGRRLNDLNVKAARGQITNEEDYERGELKREVSELNQKLEKYSIGDGGETAGAIAGTIYDLWNGAVAQKEILGGGIAAGAAIGAVVGAAIAAPFGKAAKGALSGAGVGARKALILSGKVAQIKDVYEQSFGEVYGEIDDDFDNSDSVARQEKTNIASGSATLMAALEVIPVQKVFGKAPFIKRIQSSKAFAQYLKSVEGSWLKTYVKNIAASGVIEGTTEGLQETVSILAGALGDTWDGSETSFKGALEKAYANREANLKRAGKATALGAAVGGSFAAATGLAGSKGAPNIVDPGQGPQGLKDVVDVPPTAPSGEPGTFSVDAESPNLPSVVKGVRALHLKIALEDEGKPMKNTAINQYVPDDVNEIRREMWRDAGITHGWFNKEDLNGIANEEEIATDLRELIGQKGYEESQLNSPIKVPIELIARIIEKYPQLTNLVKADPDGPSVSQWMTELNKAKERRAAIRGVSPVTQEPEILPEGVIEADPEDLFHGTSRSFDKFEQGARTNKQSNNTGGFFFTDKEEVAHTFATQGGRGTRVFGIDDVAKAMDEYGGNLDPIFIKNLPQDSEDLDGNSLAIIAQNAVDSGQTVYYDDENGNQVQFNSGDKIDLNDATLSIYPKGESPRIIKEKIRGRVLDLTTPQGFPKELVEMMKVSKHNADRSLYNILKSYEKEPRDFAYQMVGNYLLIPNSPAIQEFSKKYKVGRIRMNDAYESGFRSTYVPDVNFIGEEKSSSTEVKEIPRIRDEDIQSEDQVLEQPTFTDAMNLNLPAAEILKLNEAYINARLEVADALQAETNKRMDKIVSIEEERLTELERQDATERVASDERITLVEDFLNNTRLIGEPTEFQLEQIAKSKPALAINPDTLERKTRYKFENHPMLKSRGVFDPKGMNVEDVVVTFGTDSVDSLLTILSETPTREQAIFDQVEANSERIEEEARDSRDIEESKVARAVFKKANRHLMEMKILRDVSWSATKQGIKRIALPLPKMPQLVAKAKDIVRSTPTNELNVAQWVTAERRSQKKAINHILNGELEAGFREKENATVAALILKETHVTIGKVNKASRWVARLDSDVVRNELKEAGPTFEDPINYVLDVYNFDPKQKNQSKVDAYNRYVAKMKEQGKGDFSIPEEVMEWLTAKESAQNMTVDQYLFAVNMMKMVLKQARLKNKFMGNYMNKGLELTEQILESRVKANLTSHPLYNPKRAITTVGIQPWSTRLARRLMQAEDLFKNIQHYVVRLDQGKLNGFWSKMISQQLEGVGYGKGPYGAMAENAYQARLKRNTVKAVERFGKAEYNEMGVTPVYIPEFAKIDVLSNGNLTVLQLHRMLLNFGNAGNKAYFKNWGLEPDQVLKVLERELPIRHFEFAQYHVGKTFKELETPIIALEKATKGIDLEMVEREAFEAHGKIWEGWYFPIKLKRDVKLMGDDEVLFSPDTAREGIVRSPHTKERTGSDHTLDLDIDAFSIGYDEIVHDLAFRVPVRDIIVLLKNPSIANDIKSVLGVSGYNALYDHVVDITHSASAYNKELFRQHTSLVAKFMSNITGSELVNFIAGSPSTFAVNFLAFKEVIRKMGGKSGSYYVSAAAMEVGNPFGKNFKKYLEIAVRIDPTIFSFTEGLQDYGMTTLQDINPKKRWIMSKKWNALRRAHENLNHALLGGVLGSQDVYIKTVAIIAARNQYIAGAAPGHSIESIADMTPEELEMNADAYANQVAATTTMRAKAQDKALIQKDPRLSVFTRIWNESRNNLNNTIEEGYQMAYSGKKMIAAAERGDYIGAEEAFDEAGGRLLKGIMLSLAAITLLRVVAGKDVVGGEEEDEKLTAGQAVARNLRDLSLDMFGVPSIPVVRGMVYTGQTGRQYGDIFQSALTDVTLGTLDFVNVLMYEDARKSLTDYQLKRIFRAGGIWSGKGAPIVNSYQKWLSVAEAGAPVAGLLGVPVEKAISAYKDKYGNPEELDEYQLFEKNRNQEKTEDDEFMSEISRIEQKLYPDKAPPLSDYDYKVIKFTESKGEWDAYPKFKDGSPRSDAFGLYQFVPKTWRSIVLSTEGIKAGLTMSGRTSQDTWQQEVAMRIFTRTNARILRNNGVPVNRETIYFAHHFSPGLAKHIYGPLDKAKVHKLIASEENIKANEWIGKAKNVGQFKASLKALLDKGEEYYRESLP